MRVCVAGPDNFGDQLTIPLLERIFGLRAKPVGIRTAEVVGAGSVLEWARETAADFRRLVWGAGFIQEGLHYDGSPLQVTAVRGRLTWERMSGLVDDHTPLGDPGLLVALAYPELQTLPKKYDIGIIPHFVDQNSPRIRPYLSDSRIHVIDVLQGVPRVLQEIAACKLVASSSLHGLIVADALGIPNYWTPLGTGVIGGSYKFRDYYSAFDMDASDHPLEDVVGHPKHHRQSWAPPPGLNSVQQGLVRAFPWQPTARCRRALDARALDASSS